MLMVDFILKQFLADFTSTAVFKRKSVEEALVKFNDTVMQFVKLALTSP